MIRFLSPTTSICCLVLFASSVQAQSNPADAIDEATIRAHIRYLADDLLEGRLPGSRGDKLSQLYIATQFQSLGLTPATGDGKWLQPVPLVGVQTHSPSHVTFSAGDDSVALKTYDEFVSSIGSPIPQTSFSDAELVFVGYGIQAPEYDWDDFKDVDLTGKVLLMMNNDPSTSPDLFAGKRRLYYGRWDYKYASAARQGAVGAIIIHTKPSAGYPWPVVQNTWSGEEFDLRAATGPRMKLKGWATEDAIRRLAAMTGHDLDSLRAAAESRDFRPVSLGSTLSMELTASVRNIDTANVLGMLEGSDPDLKHETLIYMAHHDHIGLAAERDERGDNIFNGAVDNAAGSATMLAIAKAYASSEDRPSRSVLFAAVGAEEQGLLGSQYFAENPTLAAGHMAAVINMDGANVIGQTYDINIIGSGKSSLDAIVTEAARRQGRSVTPDQYPDRGFYYRSDQFSLAKIGVPGVYIGSGFNVVGKPEGWGKAKLKEWTEKFYHQTGDEYDESWDLSGAVQDARLLFDVGRMIAELDELPSWTPGDEFEAARRKALSKVSR